MLVYKKLHIKYIWCVWRKMVLGFMRKLREYEGTISCYDRKFANTPGFIQAKGAK